LLIRHSKLQTAFKVILSTGVVQQYTERPACVAMKTIAIS